MKTLETLAKETLTKQDYKILTYCKIKTQKRNVLICLIDDDCGDNYHTYFIYRLYNDKSSNFWYIGSNLEKARKMYGEHISEYVTREYIY